MAIYREARATEAQAVSLTPIYYDAARQISADETPNGHSCHEDKSNQAIYLGRSRRDGRDDEEPYLSSEDIMIAKYQWMQVSSP